MPVTGCDSSYEPNDRSSIYVVGAAYFALWAFHLILEKYADMGPVIRRTVSLAELQADIDHEKKQDEMVKADIEREKKALDVIDNIKFHDTKSQKSLDGMNDDAGGKSETELSTKGSTRKLKKTTLLFKLTKSLDEDNTYRMRQRASFRFTILLFRSSLLAVTLYGFIAFPKFIPDHFWYLNSCTVYNRWLQYAGGLILAGYCWECTMLAPFHNVKWAIYVHHWYTILAAVNIISGMYSPLAANYGIFHIALNITSPICGAFRFQYAHKHPIATRRLALVTAVWMSTCLFISSVTASIIISRAFIIGFGNHDISVFSVVLYMSAYVGWMYDDYLAVKTYYSWSKEKYEDCPINVNTLEKWATGRYSGLTDIQKDLADIRQEAGYRD